MKWTFGVIRGELSWMECDQPYHPAMSKCIHTQLLSVRNHQTKLVHFGPLLFLSTLFLAQLLYWPLILSTKPFTRKSKSSLLSSSLHLNYVLIHGFKAFANCHTSIWSCIHSLKFSSTNIKLILHNATTLIS